LHLSGCTVVIDLPAKRSSRTQRCMLPSNLKPGAPSPPLVEALPPLVVVLPLVLTFLAAARTRHRRGCRWSDSDTLGSVIHGRLVPGRSQPFVVCDEVWCVK